MSRLVVVMLCAALSWPSSQKPARSSTDVPPQVLAVLQEIRARDAGMLAVSEEDGRFLRLLVATRGTRRALEIGTASGYSAIWIGLGLRQTGGRLITIEYDATRAKEAQAHVHRAGLADIVDVIAGDAFTEIPKLTGTFDFVFLDAWKPDYRKFFDLTFRRVDPGGVFAAHNVVNKRDEMPDFLEAIASLQNGWTSIVSPSSEGMSLTYRTR